MSLKYQVCGHCDKLLSRKSFKEHHRLFFEDGKWLRIEEDAESSASSFGLSLPDTGCENNQTSGESVSSDDSEESIPFIDFISNESHEPDKVEYWNEADTDIDDDFPQSTMPAPLQVSEASDEELGQDDSAIVWWTVTFTCLFQTLHVLSSRAVIWLLEFLKALLFCLGQTSSKVARIASKFPSTLHNRKKYLEKQLTVPSFCRYVVCRLCHSLYKFEHCLERSGGNVTIRACLQCDSGRSRKKVPLLKEIITCTGSKRLYPFLVAPNACLISSLKSLFRRPGFYSLCESWRTGFVEHCPSLSDVYCGRIWNNFLDYNNRAFLRQPNSIGFMLNIDWFQPFKHKEYSVGVIYLAVMNLPREIRFKRENIILVGLIPGPTEPSKNLNSYLTPLVADLLTLWDGVSISTFENGCQTLRCALLCVGCDLPASRKVCGFLSYTANLGCSRCYCNFGTGVFGRQNYSGFDRQRWAYRTNAKHRRDVEILKTCATKTERERRESELGCRYSCLLQLPYFDAVSMSIIDPMHNLYLGTAKYIFTGIWLARGILTDSKLHEINTRMSSLNVPSEVRFNRLFSMKYPSSLTAEQWMIWVNYYSIYCLFGLLPLDHFECWRHFVLASRILCCRALAVDQIDLFDALLLRFCKRFQRLYGSDAVTPNIHLHGHLADCVRDYGPVSNFWLFSFERFNGLLGDQPTNNRLIEVQMMTRFLNDNSHLQMLTQTPLASNDVSAIFTKAVMEHAFGFTSTKHLDTLQHQSNSGIIAATKYTIHSFSDSEISMLRAIYTKVFSFDIVSFPCCCERMLYAIIDGQKLVKGHYILARSVFPFSHSASGMEIPSRPAKIESIFRHTVETRNCEKISTLFAIVNWPMPHQHQYDIGKPFEVWCLSAFETSSQNFVIPLKNYNSMLLTSKYNFFDENVLVTVPLVM